MKINNAASWVLILTFSVALLVIAKSVIIPFVAALLIWFIVKKTRDMIDKVGFIHKYIPRWIKTVLATLLIFFIITLTGGILTANIERIVDAWPSYEANIEQISKQITTTTGINVDEFLKENVNEETIAPYLESVFNSISELLGNLVMILFYTIFLFIEETLFDKKVRLFFHEQESYENYSSTMKKIDKMLSSYISLKSLVSFMTAGLSFLVFWLVGVDSPFFWAALIFFFNFIPSVGSIIATILPAVFSLLQFADFLPFAIILFVVGAIQVVVGNYVEPRLMGNTLNISSLVAFLALAVWGAIWGITGMLLSVPITVALIIILSQFQNTRSVAILLSEKGKV